MSARAMSLEDVQRAMAAAVMMPLTASEDMREQSADGRAMAQVAGEFIAANSRLSALERLEIYNRQYWYRVLGSLAEDFPALRAVMGGRRFHALSVAYLTAHPSRSFSLRNLGSRLADWLADHAELAGRRHRLAADVARVEWAFVEAFDAAEDTPLTLEQITVLDGDSRLALQPHVQLLELEYAADDVVLALHASQERQQHTSEAGVEQDQAEDPPAKLRKLRRKKTWLAVHRLDLTVFYRKLEREELRTLMALRAGMPLLTALEEGFAGSALTQEKRATRVRQWFTTWAELGWICAPPLQELVQG